MGVAGCGKTTIGRFLADELGLRFFDGDAYHPQANVDKMSQGIPLNDADREGWLARLRSLIEDNERDGRRVVVACSALKAQYRQQLRGSSAATHPRFIHLVVTPATAELRLAARSDHFMPASLVASQFDTLEAPHDAITIDATRPLEDVQHDVITKVRAEMA